MRGDARGNMSDTTRHELTSLCALSRAFFDGQDARREECCGPPLDRGVFFFLFFFFSRLAGMREQESHKNGGWLAWQVVGRLSAAVVCKELTRQQAKNRKKGGLAGGGLGSEKTEASTELSKGI